MVRIAILGAGFMGGTHGTAYQNISRRINGEEVPYLELTAKKGFFRRIFKK